MRLFSRGPGDHPGAAGLIPVPAAIAQAYQSRGMIDGSPGTRRIPAPRPSAVPQDWSKRLHNSADAPAYWLPAVYFQRGQLEHAPVSVDSDNQMPVPAVDPRGRPAVMASRPVFLGQQQIGWPKISQRYGSR